MPAHPHTVRPSARRRAFTLIEVLVVMGIIVLLIAVALPAFNFITGSRSTEAAGNQIGAALGIARAQAIGLQKHCGIMFLIEPTSDRVQIALVQETDRPASPDTDAAEVDVYLDLAPDSEFAKLPVGVGVQTVTNGQFTSATTGTINDRYVGFNTVGIASTKAAASNKIITQVGGVILFDANGMLASSSYGFRTRSVQAGTPVANRMGAVLMYDQNADTADANSKNTTPADYLPVTSALLTTNARNLPVSQLGLVMFDSGVFDGKGFTRADTRTGASETSPAKEADEETWLDANATPLMINRYNGTLIRGE